jgi:hypothetical protein
MAPSGPVRDPIVHRPFAEEAMDRNIVVQAMFLSLVCWLFAGVLMGSALLGMTAGILIVLITPFFCYLLSKGFRALQASVAHKMIGGLVGAGNIKYQQGFSIQESLVARGRFDEAAESFRAHLAEFPDDIAARYRLATLHLRERKDPAAAEEEFLALRRRRLDPSTQQLISNHLVDLYRATDQRGRLMAELSRMMREHPNSAMGTGAARLLEELKRAP